MRKTKRHEQIAILDFGSQYTHLISRRLRDIHVFTEIYPPHISTAKLRHKNVIGIILSGGPNSVYDITAPQYDPALFDFKVPILGICYGHQLIAHYFGGRVKKGKVKEYGFAKLKVKDQSFPLRQGFGGQARVKGSSDQEVHRKLKSNVFNALPSTFTVWMSHGDSVMTLPKGFISLGETSDCSIAAMAHEEKKIYGLQFHPEVTHTHDENKILYNFAVSLCGAAQDWNITDVLKEISTHIKKEARNKKVFMLVSGGVDSTVAFALLEKTLGKSNVVGLHIDSGLMRHNESADVAAALAKAHFDNLHSIPAEDTFLARLRGITDPEQKRMVIGEGYLDVAKKWFKKYLLSSRVPKGGQRTWLLGQGTIYPDTIESGGTEHADKIKTHHNRIPRIQTMIKQGTVIEPLKNFYKDEVRAIGAALGLPPILLHRHPFPGPGLGVMTLCSPKKLVLPRLKNIPPDAVVLPIQSTGVQGDERTYAFPLAINTSRSRSGFPWEKLTRRATDITNRYRAINRVVITLWRRSTTPFMPTPHLTLTKDRLDLLRKIHHDVHSVITRAGLYHDIWEFPIILVPIGTTPHGQSVVLRPISSQEAMTVTFYRLKATVLNAIIKKISAYSPVDALFYDITNKPPATIQWE